MSSISPCEAIQGNGKKGPFLPIKTTEPYEFVTKTAVPERPMLPMHCPLPRGPASSKRVPARSPCARSFDNRKRFSSGAIFDFHLCHAKPLDGPGMNRACRAKSGPANGTRGQFSRSVRANCRHADSTEHAFATGSNANLSSRDFCPISASSRASSADLLPRPRD